MTLPWLLVACTAGAPSPDPDGDGFVAGDCDPLDPLVFPGAPESGDGRDRDCDGVAPLPRVTIRGSGEDGFGHAVWLGERLLVGAPFSGERVGALPDGAAYTFDVTWASDATLDASSGGRLAGGPSAALGAALASDPAGTWIAAPGAGTLVDAAGAVVLEVPELGGAVAARDGRLAVRTRDGAWADGRSSALGRRAEALAWLADGTLVVGHRHGEVAVRVGARTIARASLVDEAGAALLVADVDGDGDEDLVVGAPGSGRVYVVDPADPPASFDPSTAIGPGDGRFGAALGSTAAGVLEVGAPMYGADAQGAVYRLDGLGPPSILAIGESAGASFGAALHGTPRGLAVGAPGAGLVRVLP